MDTKKIIVLTGATGNLGSRVMAEFLLDPSVELRCLVYGASLEEATKSFDSVFAFWECDPGSRHRVRVFLGDISKDAFGLSQELYAELGDGITHIIHCAANFKINLPLEEAIENILGGTRRLVELSEASYRAGCFKRFNYISTVEVAGKETGIIKEEFFDPSSREYLNTYEIAKAQTEVYLRSLGEEGYPFTVYRPAMLVGDSSTGKILNPQSVYHLITDMFLSPKFPLLPGNSTFTIDPIPIDILAKAMYCMYDAEETKSQVYHLTSGVGATLTLKEFVCELQNIYNDLSGVKIPLPYFVSPYLFKVLLSIVYPCTWGNLRAELFVQKNFVDMLLLSPRFDNTKAVTFLSQKGVAIPPLSSYLKTLCVYFHATKRELALLHKKK